MEKIEDHKEIILEALRDYRNWWDDSCEFWAEKKRAIDAAIKFLIEK